MSSKYCQDEIKIGNSTFACGPLKPANHPGPHKRHVVEGINGELQFTIKWKRKT